MKVAKDFLEFLNLRLTLDRESNHISVQIFTKTTNTFIYILPCTCSPKNKIENIFKGAVSRLRRIYDSGGKFEMRSAKYQKYLIVRNYKPSKFKKQFSHTGNISREEARRPKTKVNFLTSCYLITQNNSMFLNIKNVFQKYLPVLHSI